MNLLRINLADLTRMQREWASLLPHGGLESLSSALGEAFGGSHDGRLAELAEFGEDPGNLRCLHFVPDSFTAGAPLVVVLHGCGQQSGDYDAATGWSTLAERHGFALLYPEQRRANNAHTCFNWFEPGDSSRGQGELGSIHAMVETMLREYRCDPARVFVTGLSAGGAMTAALLANYPETFAAGAIVAGLPYGAASDARGALAAMAHCPNLSPAEWGDHVRAASPNARRRPVVAIWHGDADTTVAPGAAIESAKQWTDVHGIAESAGHDDVVDTALHRTWRNAAGDVCVELYAVNGLGHGAAIDTHASPGRDVGRAARFVLDCGVASTWHIARSWRLMPAEHHDRNPLALIGEAVRTLVRKLG